jgi:Predicted ATPase
MRWAAVTGPLLERNGELARIESALNQARSGSGTFVVVEGPAGIGKTSLLAAARTVAAESGMRVLRSRATEVEREFPFGIVRQLFEPTLIEASESERAELLEGAAGVAAGLLGLGGPATTDARREVADPSFAILHGLYWMCANVAAAGPLCVVVDDVQWADAPSLRYLAFLVTRVEELSVTLLAATRPSEQGVDAKLLATLMAAPSADVVRLRPLRGPRSASSWNRRSRTCRTRASSTPACARLAERRFCWASWWGHCAKVGSRRRLRRLRGRANRRALDRTLDPAAARPAARARDSAGAGAGRS